MKERGNRDELVIATKYTGAIPATNNEKIKVNRGGNHIKSLMTSLEGSLTKMQTSYVDIVSTCLLASLSMLVTRSSVSCS
jgi:aryl-alcohol dehydrogenase-like predicted oxidoreductase